MASIELQGLQTCTRCKRLVEHIAQVKPARGRTKSDYHSAPVNGFGDLDARICLVGLAPGAHGANRTGRPFTGDGAGDFMYPLLHQAGFSNQPEAIHKNDGLTLCDLYITNAVKCLPPDNKPNTDEFKACQSYLEQELQALEKLKVIIALGHGAHSSLLRLFKGQGMLKRLTEAPFAHASTFRLPNGLWLVGCYHTSRYNVQTGRMTSAMFLEFLEQVRKLAALEKG